jgi:exonuclease III
VGYAKPCFKSQRNCNGGGVMTWVNKELEHETVEELSHFEDLEFESLVTRVKRGPIIYLIINVYRPPSGDVKKFISQLKIQLEACLSTSTRVFVIGDCNINTLSDTWQSRSYLGMINNLNLEQVVKTATRAGPVSNTLMDHIICSPQIDYVAEVIEDEIAD